MRLFGVGSCLAALGLTCYSAITYKAPLIEEDIRERTARALAETSVEEFSLVVDGRTVTLQGAVHDDQERLEILEVASTVWGSRLDLEQDLQLIETVAPYRFGVTKNEGGRISVQGFAPSAEIRTQIHDDAVAIFGQASDIEVNLAKGEPKGDWRAIVGLGMDALATLEQGELVIQDMAVTLSGNVSDPADTEAIDIFADAAPNDVVWTNDLSAVGVLPEATSTGLSSEDQLAGGAVDPFTFKVVKNTDGSLMLSGYAPDIDTRDIMIDQAKSISPEIPIVANIRIAEGMPNPDWPELVYAGIGAMAQVEAGTYEVIGDDVAFDGNVTDEEQATTETTGNDDVVAKLIEEPAEEISDAEASSANTAADSDTALTISLHKKDDGSLLVQGLLPKDMAEEKLIAALTETTGMDEIDIQAEQSDVFVDEIDWLGPITDKAVALTVVESGSLTVTDDQSKLVGVVDTPEDISAVQAMITKIAPSMAVDLQPIDPRSAASVELVVSPSNGVTFWGTLPEGLTEEEAAEALGLATYEGGLKQDGRGDAVAWRDHLAMIGGYLPQFEHVGIKLDENAPRIEGKLHASGDVDQITAALTDHFGESELTVIDVSITALTHDDGTTRKNPLTGADEVFDRGYWLPVVSFSSDLSECKKRSSDILGANKITFLRGQSTLDTRAEKTVDALAAVAIKCLKDKSIRLEVGGHTDSRGATALNRALSQERADVIYHSLTARGVDPASIAAIGYGADRPIANDDTADGRAKNRRITFKWQESGTND